MKCPFCKVDDDRVVDSRASSDGFAIRRRRECTSCNRRYTTYERIEESPLRVVKKDDRREPFDRRKILSGLLKACEKRPVPLDALERITETIEGKVLETFEREVPSAYVGRLVMEELKKVDPVAYVRFASVYREFKDVKEFQDELETLIAAGHHSHSDGGASGKLGSDTGGRAASGKDDRTNSAGGRDDAGKDRGGRSEPAP